MFWKSYLCVRFGYVMDTKKQLEVYLFDLEKVTLEARNIFGGNYNVLSNEDFSEQVKIMKMFLRLAYWD